MDCTPEQSPTSRLWGLLHLWVVPSPFSYLNGSRCEPLQAVLEEAPLFNIHFMYICVYIIYIYVVTSGIGKTSNFLDLLEIYFLKQKSSIWKQLWSNDNYNIWRESTHVWFCLY